MTQYLKNSGQINEASRILFVCLGNICRSPTAEVVCRSKAKQMGLESRLIIDSAGISDLHAGQAPDMRSQLAARKHGYDLSFLRSRPVIETDFYYFDQIIAMDKANYKTLLDRKPTNSKAIVGLLLRDFALKLSIGDNIPESVPDPYYGGEEGFDAVLSYIELACDELLKQLSF